MLLWGLRIGFKRDIRQIWTLATTIDSRHMHLLYEIEIFRLERYSAKIREPEQTWECVVLVMILGPDTMPAILIVREAQVEVDSLEIPNTHQ